MKQSIFHLSPMSILFACPQNDAPMTTEDNYYSPEKAASNMNSFLSFEMLVNSTTLYIGQYYKFTYTLTNNSFDVLTLLELHCNFSEEWQASDTNVYQLPAYISLLAPGETLSFTISLQLVGLPKASSCTLNSFVSYHVNCDAEPYIQNSLPILFTVSPTQAVLALTAYKQSENETSYELLVENIGAVTLYDPVLYLYMLPSVHLMPCSLTINDVVHCSPKPSQGIHLSAMLPHTFYNIHLTTQFLPGYPKNEPPIVQLITNSIMFHPMLIS